MGFVKIVLMGSVKIYMYGVAWKNIRCNWRPFRTT